MAIPTTKEISDIMAEILSQGQVYRRRDIIKAVKEHLINNKIVVEEDLYEMLESGVPKLDNRIEWAIYILLSQGKLKRIGRATYVVLSATPSVAPSVTPSVTPCTVTKEELLKCILEEQSPEELMSILYKKLTEDLKARLLDQLSVEEPIKFQRIVLKLLKKIGYGEPVKPKPTRDEGIDGIVKGDKFGIEEIYIQTKRWSDQKVGSDVIDNFIGAIKRKGGNKGVIITTSDFTDDARRAVEQIRSSGTKIVLIDGNTLANLMIEYGVGVYTRYIYEIKDIDENFFREEI